MTKRNPASNPKLFGQDLVGAGVKAVGATASAALNEKLLWPRIKNMVPVTGHPGNALVPQVVHGLATLLTGVLLGKVVGAVGQRQLGGELANGGTIMAVAEGIGAVVPGFSLSGSFPTSLRLPPPTAVPALSPGNAPALPLTTDNRVFSGI